MKDYYSDQGHFFTKAFSTIECPDFVKTASIEDADSLAGLPDSAFAEPNTRTFPIHDPAHIYVSAAYYLGDQKNATEAPVVGENIRKAAAAFRLTDEIEKIANHMVELQKKKVAQTKSASWEIKTDAGRYAGPNDSSLLDLQRRATVGCHKCAGLNYNDVPQIAKQMIPLLMERNLPVSNDLYKFAGDGIPDEDFVLAGLQAREILSGEIEKVADLKKTFMDIVNQNAFGKLGEFTEQLKGFDKEARMDRFYGSRLIDAHRTVYSMTIEDARKVAEDVSFGKQTRTREELVSCGSIIQAAMGDKFASVTTDGKLDVDKVAALPESDRKVIGQFLA
jgi:hypothetical protein